MRVLVKIVGELRVYGINAVYNLNSIDDETSETSNRLVIECGDTDNTTLMVPLTKEKGEDCIKKLAKDGYIDITDIENIEVEASLIGCKENAAGISKLDILEQNDEAGQFISFQDSDVDTSDWNC